MSEMRTSWQRLPGHGIALRPYSILQAADSLYPISNNSNFQTCVVGLAVQVGSSMLDNKETSQTVGGQIFCNPIIDKISKPENQRLRKICNGPNLCRKQLLNHHLGYDLGWLIYNVRRVEPDVWIRWLQNLSN